MAVVELVVEMPEMADTESGDLEDEDRIAVPDHVAARSVAEIAPDVGGHVADEDVADALRDVGGRAALAPAVQNMGNAAPFSGTGSPACH